MYDVIVELRHKTSQYRAPSYSIENGL